MTKLKLGQVVPLTVHGNELGHGVVSARDGARSLVLFKEPKTGRMARQWVGPDGKPIPSKAQGTTVDLLRAISPVDFADKPVPPRQWIVPGLVPDRNVTLLTGDGGTGKSLLALQLAVAVALANDHPEIKWFGQSVTGGRALYLSAEDETDELHRRLFDINADCSCGFADLENFELLPLAGQDAVLAAPANRSDIIRATPLWRQLIQLIETRRPKLVILDTLADLFAGNENSRPQARQFISMLRGVALEYDLAFVVLAHPSLTGMSAGTGSSGSTGWNNSVRSRLYLNRVLTEIPGEKGKLIETDPDLRTLITTKTNYGRKGDEVRLRWSCGGATASLLPSTKPQAGLSPL